MLEFRQAQNKDELRQLQELRYRVYCLEKEFLPTSDYPDGIEADEFDQHSVHFIATNGEGGSGEILGTMRLILPSELGFPVETHFELSKPIQDPQRTVEFSRLMVAPEARKLSVQILMGLSREAYRYFLVNGIEHCYAVLEDSLLKLLTRVGLPFREVGHEKWFMGGYTRPVYLSASEAVEVLQTNNALFYTYLCESSDLPTSV